MIRRALLCAAAIAIFLPMPTNGTTTSEAQEPGRITLAVMYFTNRGGEGEWDWLRKGLADLLITDLASSDRLLLVERERMQAVLKELKVSESGAIDKAVAIKAARIAKVDAALFGSYQVTGDEVEIEAHIVDLETASVRRVEWVKGTASEVHEVEKQLAGQLIANLDVELTEAERERLKRLQTDSVDAMAHFYRGLDLYDRGDYPHAFAGFRAAASKDSSYVHTRLWVAKIYIAMDEVEHGLLAYRTVLKEFPDDPLTLKVRFAYARALEARAADYEAATREYTKVIESFAMWQRSPDELVREKLEREYEFEKLKDLRDGDPEISKAYRSLSGAYYDWRRQRELESSLLARALYHRAHSRKKLGDVGRAIDDMFGAFALVPGLGGSELTYRGNPRALFTLWYYDLISSSDEAVPAPAWVYRFKSEDDSFVTTPSDDPWWGNKLSWGIWQGAMLEAPPGKVFDKIYAEVEILPVEGESFPVVFARGWNARNKYRKTIMIRNFDPKELSYSYEADIDPNPRFFCLHPSQYRHRFKRVEIRASFKTAQTPADLEPQRDRTILEVYTRPQWSQTWVNGLRTLYDTAKVYPGMHIVKVAAPGYPTKEFEVRVGEAGLREFISLEDDWAPIVHVAEEMYSPAMILDHNGVYRIVAEGASDGATDLYQMVSRDALNWGDPKKLPINSPEKDSCPYLIQAEDGTLVLAWRSDRSEDSSVICTSTSEDGRTWTDPVILRRPDTRRGFGVTSLWQDCDGVFWLKTDQGPYRSEDARTWSAVFPPAETRRAARDWRVPAIKEDENGLYLEYNLDGTVLRGGEALHALGMRRGEARSYGSVWHEGGYLRLVMLPDGSLLAAGTFALRNQRGNRRGLVALTHDGDVWTTPYHRPISAVVWDRGSRLVCMYNYKGWSRGLALSFCDIAKLAGRPEQNPTPLHIIRPKLKPESPKDPRFSTIHTTRHIFGYKGRVFCTAQNQFKDACLYEIDPETGEAVIHMRTELGMGVTSKPRWCDSDGRYLWVATQNGGLYRLGLADGESKWYREQDGLVSDKVHTVRCHEGKVYVGTLSGLNILDPDTGAIETLTKADGMPDNSIASIAFQGPVMWLGTVGNGAIMYDRRSKEWTHFRYEPEKIGKGGPDLCSEYQPAIIVYGDLVYFPSYGLAEYNARTKQWNHYMPGPYCNGAFRDGDLLWYAAGGDGILTFNMKTKEVRRRFVRTPSNMWYSGPNFPGEFALFGDRVLIVTSGEYLTLVSKEELLRNSCAYEQWKNVDVYTREPKEPEVK